MPVMSLLKKLQERKWECILLFVIITLGIFLRTYNFHDWLRFSPDEARDATYINNALLGKARLPALGPQAGNTMFYLGPLYYQAEYATALIFGSAPDKLAYLDLFFSVLAIPLLFFFLRKYFSLEISLALDVLLSLSIFAISMSRFASNPNSIPFFVLLFLYGLLELMEDGSTKKKYLWASAVGISMGVGIQLHALLFVILPTVALLVCGLLMYRKNLPWKSFFLVVFFFLLINGGQISYELQNGGANTAQLFRGASSESSIKPSAFMRNVSLIFACQIQANIHIVVSAIDIENCGGVFDIAKAARRNSYIAGAGELINGGILTIIMGLTVLFSVGGYVLAGYRLKKEGDRQRRNFLGLFLVYNSMAFVVLVPVASQISIHYFNILIFAPFILLGLWLDFLAGWKKEWRKILMFGMVFLCLANTGYLVYVAQPYIDKSMSDANNSILGEITPMVDYLIAESDQKDRVYIDGTTYYLKRFFKPFDYLSRRLGVEMIRPDNDKPFLSGTRFFYISGVKEKNVRAGETLGGDRVLAVRQFMRVIIYTLLKQ